MPALKLRPSSVFNVIVGLRRSRRLLQQVRPNSFNSELDACRKLERIIASGRPSLAFSLLVAKSALQKRTSWEKNSPAKPLRSLPLVTGEESSENEVCQVLRASSSRRSTYSQYVGPGKAWSQQRSTDHYDSWESRRKRPEITARRGNG